MAEHFSSKIRNKDTIPSLLFDRVLEVLSGEIGKEKAVKVIQIDMFSLFPDYEYVFTIPVFGLLLL